MSLQDDNARADTALRFPALPGQEERTKRALQKGSIGNGSVMSTIAAWVVLLVFFGAWGLLLFGMSNPGVKLIGLAFWGADLVLVWTIIPLFLEDRRLKRERKA
jgi:hypothetical protein